MQTYTHLRSADYFCVWAAAAMFKSAGRKSFEFFFFFKKKRPLRIIQIHTDKAEHPVTVARTAK